MKRFWLLAACLMLLFLTGCGARVISQTDFDYGGGGVRDVQIYISDIVKEVSEEDLANIDEILKAAVPEGMNYARSREENGELKYHFMFFFSDIDDYNAKVSGFLGKKHEATWYTADTLFLSDIAFAEEECGYELASWAVKALQNSAYKRFTTLFDKKNPTESVFTLNGEEMFRGTGDPSFTKEMAPVISDVRMFSDFEANAEPVKTLVMRTEAVKLQQMDAKQSKAELTRWCENVDIDRDNGVITMTFAGEQAIRDFLRKADPSYKEKNVTYQTKETPYRVEFELSEEYTLSNFFKEFRIKPEYLLDYVSLPDLPYSELAHLSEVTNPEEAEGYEYQGSYRLDHSYYLHVVSVREAALSQMDVRYSFDSVSSGERQVKIRFAKNGCKASKTEMEEAFAAMGLSASVTDMDDELIATIVDKIGDEAAKSFENVKGGKVSAEERAFHDEIVFADYVPETGEGKIPSDEAKRTVEVMIDPDAKAVFLALGEEKYDESALAGMAGDDSEITLKEDWNSDMLVLEIHTSVPSMRFRSTVMIIGIVAVMILAGFAIYFLRKRLRRDTLENISMTKEFTPVNAEEPAGAEPAEEASDEDLAEEEPLDESPEDEEKGDEV